MGRTITEKILASHCNRSAVEPGELITAKLDLVLSNDITAPIAIREFAQIGVDCVFDKEKIALVPDHYTPAKDIKSAQQVKAMRDFARKYGITHFWEIGRVGIEHTLLPDTGLVLPGDAIIGGDSHTCTYGAIGAFSTGVGSTDVASAMALGECWFKVPETIKFVYHGKLNKWVGGKDLILYTIGKIGVDGALYCSMEFTGEAIENLPMAGRFTMCNMAIEAGGKNGIIPPDDITLEYVKQRAKREFKVYASDPDAKYKEIVEIDCSTLEPQVSFPHLPENARPISQVGNVPIDQSVIGSCTNGRIEDLRAAAATIDGRHVARSVQAMVVPGSQAVKAQAEAEGLDTIFTDAGFEWRESGCSMCLGMNPDILQPGERCASTSNRNFEGRQGRGGRTHLVSPRMAAAAAVEGRFVDVRDWAGKKGGGR